MKGEISRDRVHQIAWCTPVRIVLPKKTSEDLRMYFNICVLNAINIKEMIERLCMCKRIS